MQRRIRGRLVQAEQVLGGGGILLHGSPQPCHGEQHAEPYRLPGRHETQVVSALARGPVIAHQQPVPVATRAQA